MQDEEVYNGVVIWFSKGIGFLKWERGGLQQKDMFCHYSDINSQGYKTLKADQKVIFKIGVNHHGQPKAIEVTVIG